MFLVAVLLDLAPARFPLARRRKGRARRRSVEQVQFARLEIDRGQDIGGGDAPNIPAIDYRIQRLVGIVGIPRRVDKLIGP